MGVAGSPFCEHKKLRTSCAACKPAALPATPLQATPFVSAEEREKKAAKRERAAESRSSDDGAAGAEPREPKTQRPTGPGKPLLPQRAKKRGVSADEAAAATAWWVKK